MKSPTSENVIADATLVAACGLYCGACRKYLAGKCPGCRRNEKASWCAVRTCNQQAGQNNCAQCIRYTDPMQCGKFNNVFSKFFALVFRSDRAACIAQIRAQGLDGHAQLMAGKKAQTLRRGNNNA